MRNHHRDIGYLCTDQLVNPMFLLSKIFSAVVQPMLWLALWWALGLLLLNRWRRVAIVMLWGGLAVLGLLGVEAIPDALLRPLENRFPIPAPAAIPRHAGVIVLGGAFEGARSYQAHGQVPLSEGAERMTVPLAWMRLYPNLELVFSGGEGGLFTTGVTESELARQFYQEQGMDLRRIKFEAGSRNTRENARLVAALLGSRCKEPWLLVTSASHMARSMAEFEAVGCRVTPYPVDFRTGRTTPLIEYSLVKSLARWQIALHEWLGLMVYRSTR